MSYPGNYSHLLATRGGSPLSECDELCNHEDGGFRRGHTVALL